MSQRNIWGFTSHSQHSIRCGTTLLRRPWGCSSAGWEAVPARSTHMAARRWILHLTSADTPLTSAGCLRHILQSTGTHTNHTELITLCKAETKKENTMKCNVLQTTSSLSTCHSHTWLQGPVNHSMRFSQGPLLQTWEFAGRSLPHPSRGRLLMWLFRQRTPRVRTPIPHSAEHCGDHTHFTPDLILFIDGDWTTKTMSNNQI